MINTSILEEAYRGKRVFLTGHTGFKGSWLLSWLDFLGAHTKGYSLAPIGSDALYLAINGNDRCESIFEDIRNQSKMIEAVKEFKPDYIFHLAAQPLVRQSYQNPAYTFETNVLGTTNVLEAMRQLDQPCNGVFITTDKVYENKEWHYPYRETDRLGGHDPYSASKAASELVIDSYRNSFFSPYNYSSHGKSVASARAGNVIGGGDWSQDRIIPDIVRSLQKSEPVIIRNPQAVRPWQHVIEPLYGYLLLGAKMAKNPTVFAESWNFGPLSEDTFTVADLVKKAIAVWGSGTYQTPQLGNQPHEAKLLKLDISKSIEKLNWRPKWNASIAITETIHWYKNAVGESAHNLVLDTIKNY